MPFLGIRIRSRKLYLWRKTENEDPTTRTHKLCDIVVGEIGETYFYPPNQNERPHDQNEYQPIRSYSILDYLLHLLYTYMYVHTTNLPISTLKHQCVSV